MVTNPVTMECINLSAAAILCILLFVFWIYLSESDLATEKLKTSSLSADYYKLLFSRLLYWHTIAAGQMYVWLLQIIVLSF